METLEARDGLNAGVFGTVANARSIALSAGDLSAAVRVEVDKLLDENKNKQVAALKQGLQRLQHDGHITDAERRVLSGLIENVFKAVNAKSNDQVAAAAMATSRAYHTLVGVRDASPAALAIASVCNGTFEISAPPPGGKKSGSPQVLAATVTITPGTTGAGAAVGSVIGGVIGGIVGGGIGAGIGAAIGGAAGAAIGACNEKGK